MTHAPRVSPNQQLTRHFLRRKAQRRRRETVGKVKKQEPLPVGMTLTLLQTKCQPSELPKTEAYVQRHIATIEQIKKKVNEKMVHE